MLAARRPEVLAHLSTWDGGAAMAVHNFADRAVRVTLRLPADARDGNGWRHLFGVATGDGQPPPTPEGGRLSVELPPYGYHWFGRREGR